MSDVDLQNLRRIVGAVARLQGETIRDLTVRSDIRHVKIEFESGLILVIASEPDSQGRPRLAVDVVEVPQNAAARHQIEVRFD